MRKFLITALTAMAFVAVLAASFDATAQSSSDPNVCFKTCIETYGANKKQACALQCGFGTGNTSGGQARDCGAIYKQCLAKCASDNTCKSQCRKQRTNCY